MHGNCEDRHVRQGQDSAGKRWTCHIGEDGGPGVVAHVHRPRRCRICHHNHHSAALHQCSLQLTAIAPHKDGGLLLGEGVAPCQIYKHMVARLNQPSKGCVCVLVNSLLVHGQIPHASSLRHLRVRPDCLQNSSLVLSKLSWSIKRDGCCLKPVWYGKRQRQRKLRQETYAV